MSTMTRATGAATLAAIACFATMSMSAPLGASQGILPLEAVDLVDIPRLDFQAIDDGYVSVTPLHLDLTNYGLLEDVRAWDLTL